MRRLALVVCFVYLLVGCGADLGDGEPLAATHDLVIVAHEDDDLLFMQPDVIEAVQSGRGVTLVYVTAGNGTSGVGAAEKRYAGLREAYAAAAGQPAADWDCGWIEPGGHFAEHCRLAAAKVSLLFLGYPDGGKEGQYDTSLLHLWEGTITGTATIAQRSSYYDREQLIGTVASVIRATSPSVIRTLEVASTHGRDHSDHMVVGALALLAAARTESRAAILSYRGYDIADEPVDKIDPLYDAVFPVLAHYEACATGCAPCGEACTTIDPTHVIWLHYRYAVGFRPHAHGRLRGDAGCLDEQLRAGGCDAAPVWRLGDDGALRIGDRCVAVGDDGALGLGDVCARWFLDDEGHLWSGAPPAPSPAMAYAHLTCLSPRAAGTAALELCGADHAPTWTFAPVGRTLASPIAGAAPDDLRLGDVTGDGKADLCAVVGGTLTCAAGDGTGGFAVAAAIAPLAIDPPSLVIGGGDACGRDAGGVVCATGARWTSSFGDAAAVPETDASLARVGDQICGVDTSGVACAARGAAATTRSSWPAAGAAIWPADLDGDGVPDWCAATPAGPACGLAAEAAITRDGAPWAFALQGKTSAPAAPFAAGDVDGDGRADLCGVAGAQLVCARSQGHGFGPPAVIADLPAGAAPSALALGDLDGDAASELCAIAADGTLWCTQP